MTKTSSFEVLRKASLSASPEKRALMAEVLTRQVIFQPARLHRAVRGAMLYRKSQIDKENAR